MNLSRESYELSVKLNNLTTKRNISWTQFDLIAFGLYYFVLVREILVYLNIDPLVCRAFYFNAYI
jgi:hypothetical protein